MTSPGTSDQGASSSTSPPPSPSASPPSRPAADACVGEGEAPTGVGDGQRADTIDRAERPKRKKKPTYAVRKEEKLRLERDVKALEAELKDLKRQRAAYKQYTQQHKKTKALVSGEDVREATRRQEMSLVSVHSALSGYVTGQGHMPFEMWIYLGTDPSERRATLSALKAQKLRAGEHYLHERARFLAPMRAFAEHTRYDTPEGDFCALRFDITPYEGVSDARKVYDALGHYFSNMEIWLTEILGDVTVRENDDSAGRGITQIHLLSVLPSGVKLEMNKVMYTDFYYKSDDDGNDGAYGMYTADYVDKDELYPYCPDDRLRLDVTGVLTVREMKRPVVNAAGERGGEETIVVMTRVCQLKLRASTVKLPPGTMHDLREGAGNWEDVMMRTVRQLVYQ